MGKSGRQRGKKKKSMNRTRDDTVFNHHSTILENSATMVRMGKEDINLLPIGRWQGPTLLVRTLEAVNEAVASLSRTPLLGFDTETRPAFNKGQKYLPSLLQLASEEEVFLFQLKHTGLPQPLLALLENPSIVKAGVAPDFDLHSLQELHPFQPKGFVDLAKIARHRGIKNHGLRGLAAVVCGIRISKSMRTTNWANNELTPQQMQYAATDAWIGREIYQRMEALTPGPTPERVPPHRE
jgi:ribonuclease D